MGTYGQKSMDELLLEKGIISQSQWEESRIEKQKTGDSIFRVLPRLGFVTQDQMVAFIAENSDVPRIELEYLMIDAGLIETIPEDLARKHLVMPVLRIGNNLTCAMVDVFNIYMQDELSSKTGLTIEPAIATESEISRAIDQYYGVGNMGGILKDSAKPQKALDQEWEEVKISRMQDISEEAPVVTFVNSMISKAVNEDASDIHVEPEENTLSIRFRIDGVLHLQTSPPKEYQAAIISRIKIISNLDISEKRKPQDGRIQMSIENKRVDIRVSSLPTVYGENIVLRLLDTSNVRLGLEQVGFQEPMLSKFRAFLERPNGILLVTGPTGSGKTTTLYSAVSVINDPQFSIVTIEDPVEYRLPGIRQTQVNTKVDLTFANGLRAILRQDPDVVMIGEIRDAETAQIAIQAALTGHLVLATLHTNNAAGAITRLLDIGVEPFLLASSIIGVLAQRLVRLKCRACAGKGCSICSMTGYKGRSGIFELLTFDENIRSLVLKKSSAEEIHRMALSAGMKSLRDYGMERVLQGITTKEEVYRVTQEE